MRKLSKFFKDVYGRFDRIGVTDDDIIERCMELYKYSIMFSPIVCPHIRPIKIGFGYNMEDQLMINYMKGKILFNIEGMPKELTRLVHVALFALCAFATQGDRIAGDRGLVIRYYQMGILGSKKFRDLMTKYFGYVSMNLDDVPVTTIDRRVVTNYRDVLLDILDYDGKVDVGNMSIKIDDGPTFAVSKLTAQRIYSELVTLNEFDVSVKHLESGTHFELKVDKRDGKEDDGLAMLDNNEDVYSTIEKALRDLREVMMKNPSEN